MELDQRPRQSSELHHDSTTSTPAMSTFTSPSTPSTPSTTSTTILDDSPIEQRNSERPSPAPTIAHDSMVTVRLSESPTEQPLLTINTNISAAHPFSSSPLHEVSAAAPEHPIPLETPTNTTFNIDNDPKTPPATRSPGSLRDELEEYVEQPTPIASEGRVSPASSEEEVDWGQLQKTEEEQPKDSDTDASTTLLLARLEQENAKLTTNPKSVRGPSLEQSPEKKPRPPSMAELRNMVTQPTPQVLRYSMIPPPPMTDLEFYAALVKDYKQTAARLPTLLSNKIRKGIPPPLRGVVWQSISGAQDVKLGNLYDSLCRESSPYEPIIGKDLGRSFPGVDMFRDPDGDGQRKLGLVLKCFSLYDTKIGYCQGLALLVGPLLMHMPDKAAFCVLVRLMERYDLRSCFLPDLAGLHVRIYQFRELLRLCAPAVSTHLDDLQVNPAYVSQWFLSFFAVTCPLPMLFRVYDVIFAEGASETLMRVALSLMRRNEARILACTELDEVMQLLLSRGLWDCYHYNADEFVDNFMSLSGTVTREKLDYLERGYQEQQAASAATNSANAPSPTDGVAATASRFLGRIWAATSSTQHFAAAPASQSPPSSSARPTNLSPGLSAPSPPLGMLRRSMSKQSLASTLNSMGASSVSIASSVSTEATSVSRDSSNADSNSFSRESTPVVQEPTPGRSARFQSSRSAEDKHLHGQIEDLLTALSELQRNQALLADQLRREQDEREEDRQAVQLLLEGLRRKAAASAAALDDEPASAYAGQPPPPPPQAFQPALPREPIFDPASQPTFPTTYAPVEPVMPRTGGVTFIYNEETAAPAPPAATSSGGGVSFIYADGGNTTAQSAPQTDPSPSITEQQQGIEIDAGSDAPTADDLSSLLEAVEQRFGLQAGSSRPPSASSPTKTELQEELTRAKEQAINAASQSQEYGRKIYELDQEATKLKEELRETQQRFRALHQDKQRLEKQVHDLRARASAASTDTGLGLSMTGHSGSDNPRSSIYGGGGGGNGTTGGLRELKLGRTWTSPSSQTGSLSKRSSSLPQGHEFVSSSGSSSPGEVDALLVQLAQAKTSEAVAKQEAEEARQKLDAFRRAYGLTPGENPPLYAASQVAASASQAAGAAATAAMGVFGRLTNTASQSTATTAAVPTTGNGGGGGGFWGWRR